MNAYILFFKTFNESSLYPALLPFDFQQPKNNNAILSRFGARGIEESNFDDAENAKKCGSVEACSLGVVDTVAVVWQRRC